MNENPYQPPSPRPPAAADDTVKRPWYETEPADWERTAAVCWVEAVAVLLVVGWNPLPPQVADASGFLRLIPGPEIIGMLGYVGLTLVLAIVPAAFCALLHYAAMGGESHPLYRRALALAAMGGGVVLTLIACGATHWLILR